MQQWVDALKELLSDPAQNATAIATGVAVVVLFVIILVLLLLAVALPSTRRVTTRSDSESRRLPGWITVTVVSLAVVALTATALVLWYRDTSSNEYCTKTCHSMALATESWAISAHQDVECIRCHEGRKWDSFFAGVALRAECLYAEATKGQVRDRKVPSEICLSCHDSILSRSVTGRDGEPFEHSGLTPRELDCFECHSAQGHVLPKP